MNQMERLLRTISDVLEAKLLPVQNQLSEIKQTIEEMKRQLDLLSSKQPNDNLSTVLADNHPNKARRGINKRNPVKNPYRPETKVNMDNAFSELRELNKRALSLLKHR